MADPRTLLATTLGGLPVQLDPTGRDYEAIRTLVIALVRQITPEWTDFSDADPGVALLEALAYVGDVQSYLTDRVQNEAYPATAQLRSSIVDLFRLIGYELSPGSASSVVMVVEVGAPTLLPVGYAVRSSSTALTPSLRFELLNAANLTIAGYWTHSTYAAQLAALIFPTPVNINDNLIMVHGTSVTNELAGTSDGTPNQFFNLLQVPLALNPDGSSPLVVRVSAVQWTAVDSFLGTEATDEVYIIQVQADGTIRILFSDGLNGKIPPNGAPIESDYRIGGGAVGNGVGRNTLKDQVSPLGGVVQVYNPLQPSGGSEPESINTARRQGPLSIRALDRAVTLEDFETLAKATPGGGISAARAASTRSPFEVIVYLAAEGANPVPTGRWYPELESGSGTIGAVGRNLLTKKAVPTILRVEPVTVVRPFIDGDVKVLSNILRDDAKREVEKNLAAFFVEEQQQFGRGIPFSRIDQLIENTRGVDSVELIALHRLPTTRFVRGVEAAFDAAVTVFSLFQPTMVFDNYRIEWQNGAIYQLRGELNGLIRVSTGSIRNLSAGVLEAVEHFSDSNDDLVAERVPQYTIQVQLGATLPQRGDVWIFGVDRYKGSLAIAPFDMVVATVDAFGGFDPSELQLRYAGGIG